MKQIDKYANIKQIYRNIDDIDRQICKYRIDIQKHRKNRQTNMQIQNRCIETQMKKIDKYANIE